MLSLNIITVLKDPDHTELFKTLESINLFCQNSDVEWLIQDSSLISNLTIFKENCKINYKYVHHMDKGIYHGMNLALKGITKSYVLFLNSGDVLLSEIFEFLKLPIKSNSVYYTNCLINNAPQIYPAVITKKYFLRNNICHQAIFYSADVFKKFSFDLNFKVLADHNLNVMLFNSGTNFIRSRFAVINTAEMNFSHKNAEIKNIERKKIVDSIIGESTYYKFFYELYNLKMISTFKKSSFYKKYLRKRLLSILYKT